MSATSPLFNRQDIFGYKYWLVGILALILAALLLIGLGSVLSRLRRLLKEPAIFLELTPPAHRDKSLLATEQLFTIFHGLDSSRSRRDKLLRRRIILSFEVVSTRARGIRYLIRINQRYASSVHGAINSYSADIKVKPISDYLSRDSLDPRGLRVMSFKQAGHFAFPLTSRGMLEEVDPIAYLNGTMTKLESGELMAFQLILEPCQGRLVRSLKRKMATSVNLNTSLKRGGSIKNVPRLLLRLLLLPIKLLFGLIRGLIFASHRPSRSSRSVRASYVDQLLLDSVNGKLAQPLFRANFRLLVISKGKASRSQRTSSFSSSLATFDLPGYQRLKARMSLPFQTITRYLIFNYRYRLPSLVTRPLILSTSEIASLYHFPQSVSSASEDVVKSFSRTLPAPVSLRGEAKLDLRLGINKHNDLLTPIGLTVAERERHLYIVGGTGSGKSTMLLGGIVQDIKSGKGVAVIDPHGDLAETILRHIPRNRIEDVIYFNPDDLDHPIGLNLLEISPGLSGNELRREKDMVTEAVVSVFRKIFSDDDSGGHRVEYILRNTIHTALTVEGATLFTVYELLTNPVYKNKIVTQLDDGNLKNFWRNEFGMAGAYQKVKMIHGITSKIGRFERSASAQPILSQAKSTIDFDDILDCGKILVCNFSRGVLGEDTSTLFGTTVLAKLQMAALRRARQQPNKRRPYYLYVDEFQNFATTAFVQMLSEARKYKLFLSMAEQSTAQQKEQRLVNIILANVGTVIAFRTASPLDEQLILPLFRPYISAGEIANLPAYNFYIRLSGVKPQEPLSGATELLKYAGNDITAQAVIQRSREQYSAKTTAKTDKSSKSSIPQPRIYKVPARLSLNE